MLNDDDACILKFQVAVVFKECLKTSVVDILTHFLSEHKERFNGNPAINPNADDLRDRLHPDATFLILKSISNQWELRIATKRVDILYSETLQRDVLDANLVIQECSFVLSSFIKIAGVSAERFGFVRDMVIEIDSPAEFLSQLFCKEKWTQPQSPFGGLHNFEIHFHKVLNKDGLDINSWTRFRTMNLISGEIVKPIFAIEQDINTLREKELSDSDSGRLSDFLKQALSLMDRTLEAFPLERQ